MFNLSIVPPRGLEHHETRSSGRPFGKGLGFVAGVVLIVGTEALFRNHALWRTAARHIAPDDPSLLHAFGRLATMLFAR